MEDRLASFGVSLVTDVDTQTRSDIGDALDNLDGVQGILRCVWDAAPQLASDPQCGEAIILPVDVIFERLEAVEGQLERVSNISTPS